MVQVVARAVPRPWSMRLGSLLRQPVTCPASTTATDAAAIMSRERTPWLLVPRSGGSGIVTEQDLTEHVLAAGRSARTPIGEITAELGPMISSDRSAADALMFMLESGRRHVPVVDAHRRVLGIISETDLVALGWRSSLMLQTRIETGPDAATVAATGRDLPRVVAAMVDEGADPVDIGRLVTLVIDTLTRRLIDLTVEQLGDPPVPWAWLTLGSSARREQGIITDQDHALAFDLQGEPLEEVDAYFLELAKAVTSGLEAAGIPRCGADVVAENRSLRRPLDHWVSAFNDWMDQARLQGGRQASILFDQRRSTGPLEAERVLGTVISSASHRPRFLARLARQAVEARPPRAHFRGFAVEGQGPNEGTLDIKRAGITPIVNLARSYALEVGVTEAGTLDRLARAAAQHRITERTKTDLEEAYRLMWRIRLAHHVGRVEVGDRIDDLVDLRSIGSLSRVQLREAFRIVRHEQRSLRRRHGFHPS